MTINHNEMTEILFLKTSKKISIIFKFI